MGTDTQGATPTPKEPKRRFWSGEIRSVSHAEKILNIAGWVFIVLAGFSIARFLGGITNVPKSDLIGALIFAGVLGLPGGLLLKRRSRGAAWFLFGLAVVCLLFLTGFGFLLALGCRWPVGCGAGIGGSRHLGAVGRRQLASSEGGQGLA